MKPYSDYKYSQISAQIIFCKILYEKTRRGKRSISASHMRKFISKHSENFEKMPLLCHSFDARSLADHCPRKYLTLESEHFVEVLYEEIAHFSSIINPLSRV